MLVVIVPHFEIGNWEDSSATRHRILDLRDPDGIVYGHDGINSPCVVSFTPSVSLLQHPGLVIFKGELVIFYKQFRYRGTLSLNFAS